MSELSEFQIGQSVELSDGRPATVRYIGDTRFADGEWVGVELEDATGKNDGAVQGQRYFECPPAHGMFIRPAAITVVEQPTPKAPRVTGKANGAALKPRPSSMVAGGSKRQSLADSSPSKSPTKQLGSSSSSVQSSRAGTPAASSRKSMLPPSKPMRSTLGQNSATARAPRQSIANTINGTAKTPSQASSVSRSPAKRPSLQLGLSKRIGSVGGASQASKTNEPGVLAGVSEPALTSPTSGTPDDTHAYLQSPLSEESQTEHPPTERPSFSRGRSPSSNLQRPPHSAVVNKELEDLKAKLRVMEKKRTDDREKLKSVEKIQAERDRLESIIQKLQAKYQPQQKEISDLRMQIKDEQGKVYELEGRLSEHDTILEVATLDREMAEETAESFKLELEALRQKYEEAELEASVLREENEELGKEMSPEDKTSQGWLQLERSNERLREALVRLRDVTQEQEADLKDQIAELEADVQDMNKLKDKHGQTQEDLEQSNGTVKELRQQLDATLGADDMIEELTDKNLTLSEKVEDLKLAIEELESLKDLNDELELNHVETEKQLQDEIDYNEALLGEEAKKAAVQDGTIQDLDYTVSRFRELVATMQSDLEDMRASQQITESEANELSNRSRAMMDLNMRLQTSAAKTQVKAIDLELGKMQAQESIEHLSIVQQFLPDAFKNEQDSVQALLRFRRLSFKAQIMHNFVREKQNGPTSTVGDDDIALLNDILNKLVWVSSTFDRFFSHVQSCNLDSFKRLGGAFYELDPVERAFNTWIDAIKRDELKLELCASELQRTIALTSHLAEVHISDDLEHYPGQVLAFTSMMHSHLETAAGTLAAIKSRLETALLASEGEGSTDESDYLEVFEKIDTLVSQSRSGKIIISKSVRQIEDLRSRSLTLDPSTLDIIEHTQESTSSFASDIRSFSGTILRSLNNDINSVGSTYSRISAGFSEGPVTYTHLIAKQQSTTAQLQSFLNLTNSLAQTIEFPSPPPPPPWKLLAQRMRDEAADSAARDTELSRLRDEVTAKGTTVAIKEKILEELSVKNEVLEKRVSESASRQERLKELEAVSESFKNKEKDYVAKLSRLRKELETLEGERETWKQAPKSPPADLRTDQAASTAVTPTSVTTLLQIDSLKAEMAALQSTVRYLRTAHHQSFVNVSNSFLSTPITPRVMPQDHLAREAKDVLKEMVHLISQPGSQPIQLQRRTAETRLRWRPAKESSTWQVQRQREEFEEWREWRDGVARRAVGKRKEERRLQEVREKRDDAAPLLGQMGLSKGAAGEVKIFGVDDNGPDGG
ncbi:uncharacterized protein KY384_004555 [Bacidia gigantensis]|uniref:uncharacterized protein n=1 Tax=Bacidia gigantensis TaxID=2732470 RepID=UPI001D03D0BC|nr:uncharacterized protein KY384_004555 [Bacidia gigantensis]KAG8531197.1 hypothetical protein KY384_004555 [Bacidia gigantensis]